MATNWMQSAELITFILCDNMLATSVALPLEQFRAAESMYVAAKGRKAGPKLQFVMASVDGKPVRTSTGLLLQPDCSLSDIEQASITYLPALWRNPKPIIERNHKILPWLIEQNRRGGIIAGVGTGCCFMAQAGLLDFRPATTHWYYFDQFAEAYPRVELKRDHFITRSDNLFCSASVNALADLTIFFIQEKFGANIARHVERHFFHEVRNTDHVKNQLQAHPDEEIAEAQSWMHQSPQHDIAIKDIAARLQLSLRTFNRRFKNATRQTPMQYLQSVRMRGAGELLQTSNLGIAEIAFKSGYQDLAHFTRLFKRHFGTTPSQYRATVRAKLFRVE
jgi:transcriptional regulator GlxA family with amidase domain